MTEVGVGYVSIIPTARGFQQALSTQVIPAVDAVGRAASGRLTGAMVGVGKAMTMFVTVPILAVGAAGVSAALKVDKAMDILRANTGATGASLKGLESVFRRVAAGAQQDFETTARVVAGLNTRLGLTGDELQDVASRMLDLAHVTRVDAYKATTAITRAMNDFGVGAEDAGLFMDQLLTASQKTGIGIDVLADKVSRFGSPMRLLGFSVQDTIAILANFEKAGVRTETVMSGMRQATSRLAKEGRDIPEAFREYLVAIQQAETATEAAGIASELFGARAGPDMAQAIREGRLSVDDLVGSLDNAGGALDRTTGVTFGTAEALTRLKNSLQILLSQIGEELTPTIDSAATAIADFAQKFSDLDEGTKSTIVNVGLLLAAFGPVLWIVGKLAGAVGGLIGTFAKLGPALMLLSGPIGWKIGLVAAAVGAVVALWHTSEDFRDAVGAIWDMIKEQVGNAVAAVNQWLEDNRNTIELLKGAWRELWAFFEDHLIPKIKELAEEVLPKIGKVVEDALPFILTLATAIGFAAAAFAFAALGIVAAIATVLTWLSNMESEVKTRVNQMRESFATWSRNVVTLVREGVNQALELIKGWGRDAVAAMNTAKDNILGVFAGAGSWLVGAGRDIVQGLIEGILGAIGGAVAAAGRLASSVIAAATGRGGFDTNSPSRVFIGVGEDVAAGLAVGLARGRPMVESAMANLAMAMPDMVVPQVDAAGLGNVYNVTMESTVPATPDEVARSLQRVDLIYGRA